MQRRTLLQYAGVGALSLGVTGGVSGTALAGGFDVSFTVGEREVGGEDESVEVDCGTTTTVQGCIVGAQSCHTAELVDYGRDDGDLQFRIETVADGTDCTDHHVAIEYEIRATDLDDRAAAVCVFHDGERVARVDCPDDGDDGDHEDSGDDGDDGDDGPGFDFGDDEEPEFDFGDERDPLEFDFGDERDPPEFDFGNDDEPPEFDFGDERDPPEFDFGD
jgi:hypothetical protein